MHNYLLKSVLYYKSLSLYCNVPIQLTAKNIQCMRAILSLAHCYGDVLGTAWYTVLHTLQHLTIMLGLKFSSSGSVKAIQVNELPTLVRYVLLHYYPFRAINSLNVELLIENLSA